MNMEYICIYNKDVLIPSVLWGVKQEKLLIAVHGDQSHKEDTLIQIVAQNAIKKGYQVLSFDLPEHGERMNKGYECNPPHCIGDLEAIYDYAISYTSQIYLFACSIGAYFSLRAYYKLDIKNFLFLSPVVDMERILQNMMSGFGISEEELLTEKRISLPIGKTLDWDYYTYVKQHPVNFDRTLPVSILMGSEDVVSEKEYVEAFSKRYHAKLAVLDKGEHYFHTKEQLEYFERWLDNNL